MPDAAPPSNGSDTNAKFGDVTALTATLIGVFTALAGGATVGGGVERVSRNYPVQTVLALLALVLASVVAAVRVVGKVTNTAETAPARSLTMRIRMYVAKLVRSPLFWPTLVFVVALALAGWALIGTARDRSTPSINATVELSPTGRPTLQAEVKANGLSAHQFVRVKIVRVADGSVDSGLQPLYLGTQGAGSNGEVDATIAFPLPPGAYDGVLVKAWQSASEPPCDIGRSGLPAGQPDAPFGCVLISAAPPAA